jgi:hypothetical protein
VNTRSRRVKRRTPRNPSAWICVSRSRGTCAAAAVSIRHCLLSALYSEFKLIIIQGLLPRIVVYLSPLLPASVSYFLPPSVTSQYLGSSLPTKCSVSLSVCLQTRVTKVLVRSPQHFRYVIRKSQLQFSACCQPNTTLKIRISGNSRLPIFL